MFTYSKSALNIYNKSGRDDKKLKEFHQNVAQSYEKIEYIKIKNGSSEFVISYEITNELLLKFQEISKLKAQLSKTLSLVDNNVIEIFLKGLIISEIESSSEIEGIHSSRKDLQTLKEMKSGKKYAIIESYLKMVNREVLFNTIGDLRKNYDEIIAPFIDSKDLKDLGANFRLEEVGVYKSANKKIHTGINGEDNIYHLMEQVFLIKNDEKLPLPIRVAMIHYLIGYIHPFYDGNGRVSRLISCDMLFEEIEIASLQLSTVILSNQRLYYEMFDVANSMYNCGDLSYFIYNFMDFISLCLTNTIDALLFQIEDNQSMYGKLKNTNLSKTEIEILFLAYRAYKNGLSHNYKEYCEILKISDVTLRKNIKLLIEKELITTPKRGRKNIIYLNLNDPLFK